MEVLDYYGAISNVNADPMPDRVGADLGEFTVERTTELLGAAKKSDSRVDGDPLAHPVRCYPEAFAVPISIIYNRINETGYCATSVAPPSSPRFLRVLSCSSCGESSFPTLPSMGESQGVGPRTCG